MRPFAGKLDCAPIHFLLSICAYNAGQSLADQGIADQAAYVGSKTAGQHNVPDNYEKEKPVLPSQQEFSSTHSGQSTGGQSDGGQSTGGQYGGSNTSQASTQVNVTGFFGSFDNSSWSPDPSHNYCKQPHCHFAMWA